ncbi:MAG: type II CAAX endopeptidase family protein, partial [Planctomycetota bacterium]
GLAQPATLADIASRISGGSDGRLEVYQNTASSFYLIDRARAGLVSSFTVRNGIGSTAATDLQLDLAAADEDVDYARDGQPEYSIPIGHSATVIEGGPLHGDTPSAHLMLLANAGSLPHIQFSADLRSSTIQGTAQWGDVAVLLPLSALFSSLCLALATFARSTKEGQYYLTPLLMVVMGLTMFCLSPAVEMTPLYSVIPVVNVTLLLKGLLLNAPGSGNLVVYAVPVLISSIGYSMLSLWWAIELYNSEDVLFREAEKFDLRLWFRQMLRTKDAVPVFPEAVFCFILILMLQFVAMKYMATDLNVPDPGSSMLRLIVVQQLALIACPALFMGLLLTTSLRATFRLRMPSLTAMGVGVGLAVIAHPLSMELSRFLVEYQVFPELPASARHVMELMKTGERPTWLLLLVFAVTPAICEELAFRGFILSGLARGGRLAIAVGISSIMFGIIHMIPQQAFNAALLGLVLGLLAIYSRSLFPAMAFHFCNNALATFYSTEAHQFNTDGVFLSRHPDGQLCYEAPLLLLCGIVGILLIMHMIKVVSKEQDLKRRGLLPAYQEARAPV